MQFYVSIDGVMEALIQAFKQYMLKSLDLRLEAKPWKEINKVPFFLQDLYAFFLITLLGKTCLLAIPKDIHATTPAAVKNHLLHIREISGVPCIYLTNALSAHNRQRLAKHGVQFVVPGRQIYLPALGIDWSERCWQKHRTTLKKQLSPSSQAVVIYALISGKKEFMPVELARALDYTAMTMTRALNELESFDICKTVRKGKIRLIHFAQDLHKIWNQSLPFLQNPVKKRIWLKSEKQGFKGVLAGLSALAQISTLSEPAHPIYAVGLQTWKSMERSIQKVPDPDEADIELEIWSYDPSLFEIEGRVDIFSLYLSLKGSGDERVEGALEKMIKGIK